MSSLQRKKILKRGRRAKASPVVLTERDLEMLSLIGLTRYLSTDQLAREFFPSPDRCRRRLRQLYDAAYLTVTLAGSTSPNLLSLTALGLSALKTAQPELGERIRLPGSIRLAGIKHHLAVVDVRLHLAAWTRAQGGVFLRWSNAGGELARDLELDGLEPDGLVEVQLDDQVLVLAIEVDCGTESLNILERKLERYAALPRETLDELWFVIVAGQGRRETVAALLREVELPCRVRVLAHEALLKQPVIVERGRAGRGHGPPGPNTAFSTSPIPQAHSADNRAVLVGDGWIFRRADR